MQGEGNRERGEVFWRRVMSRTMSTWGFTAHSYQGTGGPQLLISVPMQLTCSQHVCQQRQLTAIFKQFASIPCVQMYTQIHDSAEHPGHIQSRIL